MISFFKRNSHSFYVVSWDSRTGDFSTDIKRRFRSFSTIGEARQFSHQLEDVHHNILQNTNRLHISIESHF